MRLHTLSRSDVVDIIKRHLRDENIRVAPRSLRIQHDGTVTYRLACPDVGPDIGWTAPAYAACDMVEGHHGLHEDLYNEVTWT